MSVKFSIGHAGFIGNLCGNPQKKMNPVVAVTLAYFFISFDFYLQ